MKDLSVRNKNDCQTPLPQIPLGYLQSRAELGGHGHELNGHGHAQSWNRGVDLDMDMKKIRVVRNGSWKKTRS